MYKGLKHINKLKLFPFHWNRLAEDFCSSNPCANSGTCSLTGNSYTCTCTSQYTGQNCTEGNSSVLNAISVPPTEVFWRFWRLLKARWQKQKLIIISPFDTTFSTLFNYCSSIYRWFSYVDYIFTTLSAADMLYVGKGV